MRIRKFFLALSLLGCSCLIVFNLSANEGCSPYEQNDKVLIDNDCPGNPGQIYKKCSADQAKCCNAEDAESCPIIE